MVILFACINLHAQRMLHNHTQPVKQSNAALLLNTYTFSTWVYNVNLSQAKHISFQLSQGIVLNTADADRDNNAVRTMAALQNTVRVSPNSFFTSSIMLGINSRNENVTQHNTINSRTLSVQGDYNIKRFAVYGRFESIQRLFSQLSLPGGSSRVSFTLNSVSLGTSFRLFYLGAMDLRVGGHCTAALQPQGFNIFNSRAAFSGQFYIRLLPSILNMYDTQRASREKRRVRMSF